MLIQQVMGFLYSKVLWSQYYWHFCFCHKDCSVLKHSWPLPPRFQLYYKTLQMWHTPRRCQMPPRWQNSPSQLSTVALVNNKIKEQENLFSLPLTKQLSLLTVNTWKFLEMIIQAPGYQFQETNTNLPIVLNQSLSVCRKFQDGMSRASRNV